MRNNKVELLTETEKQVLVGQMIRDSRKRQKITAINLAAFSKTTQQIVSRVELGIERLSYSKLTDIFDCLNIEFDFSDETLNLAHELFEKYLYGFLNKENNYISYIEQIICEEYKYSFAYPIYLLAAFISKRYHKEDYEAQSEALISFYSFLPPVEKQIYFYMHSASLSEKKQFNQAKTLIKEGLSIDTKINDYLGECAKGVLYYNFSTIEYDLGRLLKAYQYNRKAKQIFDEHNCLLRSLNCEVFLGVIYGDMGLGEDAISTNQSALKNATRLNDQSNILVLEYNIAISYFYANDFENCIVASLEGLKNANARKTIDYYQLLIWSYLCLNDLKKAEEYYRKFKSNTNLSITMQAWSSLFDSFLSKESDQNKLLSMENLYFTCVKQEECVYDRIYLLKMIVKQCKKTKNTEKLLEYQTILLDILSNFGVV